MEILTFILGGIIAGAVVLFRERVIHAEKKRRDEQEYKTLWTEAVTLLASNGQLTDEQVKKITPSRPKSSQLPAQGGFSSDRKAVEIARAKQGLPPADSLIGMFSSDVRAVKEARIKFGAAD